MNNSPHGIISGTRTLVPEFALCLALERLQVQKKVKSMKLKLTNAMSSGLNSSKDKERKISKTITGNHGNKYLSNTL